MSILECKKLTIGYNDIKVCKDINFQVNKGDYLCILGENGSGKSTLIKTILGLNKILSGKISFAEDFDKHNVGYLPQQTDLQKDFPATVKEVIMSGFVSKMGFRPFYNREEKSRYSEVVNYLSLKDMEKKSYKELSGGQQQRVLLARALCATTELLILDEPTNALDSKSANKFYKLLTDLNSKGMTIIMVSHNLEKVHEFASHIVYLKDTMMFYGTNGEFEKTEIAKSINYGEGK